MLEISLFTVVALVLVLPITVRLVERNLEIFLLIMGIASVTFANLWGNEAVWKLP